MKIGIYCPVKNELSNVLEWYESCKNADYISVLDTGSTDGTLELLKSISNIRVTEALILPWRFDDAFNMAMYTLPADTDVCIRLDLDERLQPGWREAIEQEWQSDTTRMRYPYVWSWNPDGTPAKQWNGDRIHARRNYRWVGPTHEYLSCRGEEKVVWSKSVRIHQYPIAKSKNDLPLLLEFVREYPLDSRAWAYLGREYMYQRDYTNAAITYKKFLEMKSNDNERVQAFLYLAEAEPECALHWIDQAAKLVPGYREPWMKYAEYYYKKQDWVQCLEYSLKALEITVRPQTYITRDDYWTWKPYDYAAISSYNLGLYREALHYGQKSLAQKPSDARLQKNLEFYLKKIP